MGESVNSFCSTLYLGILEGKNINFSIKNLELDFLNSFLTIGKTIYTILHWIVCWSLGRKKVVMAFMGCQLCNFRSSHRKCFVSKDVLRNFPKFKGKNLCESLLFNKVPGLRPATLLKKRFWYKYFHVSFVKFSRTPFSQNRSGRLLL